MVHWPLFAKLIKPAAEKMATTLGIGEAKKWISNRWGRSRADARLERGEDPSADIHLESMVRLQLEQIAERDELHLGAVPSPGGNWLLLDSTVKAMAHGVILKVGRGGAPELPFEIDQQLKSSFADSAHRQLPAGIIDSAVTRIVAHIRSTDTGKRALDSAIDTWSAAESYRQSHSDGLPLDAKVFQRARTVALAMLEAGRRNWNTPEFIAPLSLELVAPKANAEPMGVTKTDVLDRIRGGQNLLMVGACGNGKTTFLLDLCAECLEYGGRIPIFVDAATWGRRGGTLIEYLAAHSKAKELGVEQAELMRLISAGSVTIMINGWNEIPTAAKLVCADAVTELLASAPKLNLVVVSRSVADAPNFPLAKQLEIRGLDWRGQSSIIRKALPGGEARAVLDLLATDVHMQRAARSPLILRGLIEKARKGEVGQASIYSLLAASVEAFERNEKRALALADGPTQGFHRLYLEELACWLTEHLSVTCEREEALAAIGAVARRLRDQAVIGELPKFTEILDVLTRNHLLHFDNELVRFAHQRFQEFFVATRLLKNCRGAGDVDTLGLAVDGPAWTAALRLVAGTVRIGGNGAARAHLVAAAAAIDAGLACDLAGASAFTAADDARLYGELAEKTRALMRSTLQEVSSLGTTWAIASGFPEFADDVWNLLEHDDDQVRLTTYGLNGAAISLEQLGHGAADRVLNWPVQRKIEFVHEMAVSSENYAFLVRIAQSAHEYDLRMHALNVLLWQYPESDSALQAWLGAPAEVQGDLHVVRHVAEAAEGDTAVLRRLGEIAEVSKDAGFQFALVNPEAAGKRGLDLVLERLADVDHGGLDEPLLGIARSFAPDGLMEVARKLALQSRGLPEWVGQELLALPPEQKREIFQEAWDRLLRDDFQHVSVKTIGPLADRDQVDHCVTTWLAQEAHIRALSELERRRHDHVGFVLASVPGPILIDVVLQRGPTASYEESVNLVDLLVRRMGRDPSADGNWKPDADAAGQLIAIFGDKTEPEPALHDELRCHLSLVICRTVPVLSGDFVNETCRRHLDKWAEYHARRHGHNPKSAWTLIAALAAWGPDSLKGLVALVDHPAASNLIPDAVARVATIPWASKRPTHFWNALGGDLQEGETRRAAGRALQQPDDIYQDVTDTLAQASGKLLSRKVLSYLERKAAGGSGWRPLEAQAQLRLLARPISNIPSRHVLVPVCEALTSGLMDLWGTWEAVRGLLRQGWMIDNQALVHHLEALHAAKGNYPYDDEHRRHAMADLSELLLVATPVHLMRKPRNHYLDEMRTYSNMPEVGRRLAAIKGASAWPLLLGLREKVGDGRREFEADLINALTPEHVPQFLDIIANGAIFDWADHTSHIVRAARAKASVIQSSVGAAAFADACRHAQRREADQLAAEVLSEMTETADIRAAYGLEVIDAGRQVPSEFGMRMLRSLFYLHVPLGHSSYEVRPQARNNLRTQIYNRAKQPGATGNPYRSLLAGLERSRRESGRPDAENRHPDRGDGLCWTDVLAN